MGGGRGGREGKKILGKKIKGTLEERASSRCLHSFAIHSVAEAPAEQNRQTNG
jgi:hypothetical protein